MKNFLFCSGNAARAKCIYIELACFILIYICQLVRLLITCTTLISTLFHYCEWNTPTAAEQVP